MGDIADLPRGHWLREEFERAVERGVRDITEAEDKRILAELRMSARSPGKSTLVREASKKLFLPPRTKLSIAIKTTNNKEVIKNERSI